MSRLQKKIESGDFKKGSIFLLVGAAVAFVLWDFLPYFSKAIGDTLSEIIQIGMYRYPALPFGYGILNGHWIARNQTMQMEPVVTFSLFGIVAAGIVASVIAQYHRPFVLQTWIVISLFQLGFITGHFTWPLDALKG